RSGRLDSMDASGMTTSTSGAIDEATFRRFVEGDERAFAALIEFYQRRMIGFLRICSPSREVAEELAQDTFIKLYEKRHRIHSPEKVLPWMMVTGRRLAIRESGILRYKTEIRLSQEVLAETIESVAGTQVDGLRSQ